jgi:hypothetical protein
VSRPPACVSSHGQGSGSPPKSRFGIRLVLFVRLKLAADVRAGCGNAGISPSTAALGWRVHENLLLVVRQLRHRQRARVALAEPAA